LREGPCWIVDPIDGPRGFTRGACFCGAHFDENEIAYSGNCMVSKAKRHSHILAALK
jgi:Inositol monophosphatase family